MEGVLIMIEAFEDKGVWIKGWDIEGNPIKEFIILNGTTAVESKNSNYYSFGDRPTIPVKTYGFMEEFLK